MSSRSWKKHIKKASKYAKKCLRNGHSEDEVKRVFYEKGWHPSLVDDVFELAQKEKKLFKRFFKSKEKILIEKSRGDIIVQVNNVNKSFNNRSVLKDITFDLKKGEFLGILGMSGSGKTTLLQLLIGFIFPEEGKIKYYIPAKENFFSLTKKRREISRIIGFAPQTPSFYNDLSVWDNLDYFASLYNISKNERRSRISSILDFVNLEDFANMHAKSLSGGMQRRLGIACAMIHNPKILILDEPTADLDPFMRKEIWSLTKKINNLGITVIITSHLLSELENLCSEILIIDQNKIVVKGNPIELYQKISDEEQVILHYKSENYESFLNELSRSRIPVTTDFVEGRLVIQTKKPEKVVEKAIKSKEKILFLQVKKIDMTKLFETYIQRKNILK